MASKDTKQQSAFKTTTSGNGKKSVPEIQWSVDGKPVKIDKWDGAALKNALDDAVKKIMTERYLYTESTGIMDGKLLICTLGVAFAMFALVWDYLNPFPASRPILILCVLSYFVMMGVLTLYTMYTEMGIFLVCCEKDKAGIDPDNVWMISSYIKRYDDIYNLTFSYFDGTTNQKRETTIKKSVANFFDENGVLCHDLFEPEIKKLRDGLSSGKKEK